MWVNVRTQFGRISGCLFLALALFSTFSPSAHAQLSLSLSPSIESPAQVGSSITWTATASDADSGPFWYRFSTRGPGEGRRIVRDFGPENTLRWVPVEREGSYSIEVEARNLSTRRTTTTVATFQALSNVTGGQPAIRPTSSSNRRRRMAARIYPMSPSCIWTSWRVESARRAATPTGRSASRTRRSWLSR